MVDPILSVRKLSVHFPIRSRLLQRTVGSVHAVAGVSFDIPEAETVGIIGESGCGKTTTARALVGLTPATSGLITFRGGSVNLARRGGRVGANREIQMVFQDPFSSLNPRATVGRIISEGWEIHADLAPEGAWSTALESLLEDVGLPAAYRSRYPRQLSGGERQRVAIARSLAVRPSLLICDEVVSALDVSVKAQILQLLGRLQEETRTSYLFISHDTSAVRAVAQRVLVMYLGHVVESGATDEVFSRPAHPYTRALLSSAPRLRPWRSPGPGNRIILSGEVPSISSPPVGCPFHTRCWKATDLCTSVRPALETVHGRSGHTAACHFPEGTTGGGPSPSRAGDDRIGGREAGAPTPIEMNGDRGQLSGEAP